MQKIFYTLENIEEAAKSLIAISQTRFLCFNGAMGAGKTTLIKAVVSQLEGQEQASSPTFSIVNEYQYQNGKLLGFHFDFYRLETESEALDLGIEDYFNENSWLFVEWANKVESLLPSSYTKISINTLDDLSRELIIEEV